MTISNKTISRGFILAGLMNLSVLIFSRFFTNETIAKFDPEVMSNFGLLMIILWGVAYMSIAKNFEKVKWLIALFFVEKVVYGIVWTKWMLNNSLTDVFEQDTMAGVFYSIYGINDWLFSLFFLLVFVRVFKI